MKTTALVSELIHRDCWELGCGVVFSFILVDFVDRDGSVHNTGLHRLLLNDRLNTLVDMMMHMLSRHRWRCRACVLCFSYFLPVLELRCFRFESLGNVIIISMLDVAVLDAPYLVGVRLGKHLLVLDGLDGGMVVVLVNFAVHGGGDIFVAGWGDILMLNGRVDGLVDSGVVLSIF